MRQKLDNNIVTRRNTAWVPAIIGLGLAFSLAGCSMMGGDNSDAPLGTTVNSDFSLQTRFQQRMEPTTAKREVSTRTGFAGAVVADEPTAALAARDILEKGGNAADAATGLYFALSVTYPGAAGLGGGGVCLAHKAEEPGVKSIAFLVRRPAAGGAVGVPGNVRGFAYLHATQGKSDWAGLIAPAERLAATGFLTSRALSEQLNDASAILNSDVALKGQFSKSGMTYKELDRITQIPVASTLALIRSQSVSGFYTGQTAAKLVADSAAKGGTITLSDLRNYRAEVADAQHTTMGSDVVSFPAQGLGAGAFTTALWQRLANASSAQLQAVAAETAISLGAPANDPSSLDRDFGSTAFAVVDREGGAVACALTMNGAFGAGVNSTDTGVVFAATPESPIKGLASAFLSPIMMTNKSGKTVYFAGAGAGAPKAAASIQHVLRQAAASTAQAGTALDQSPADARSPASAIICADGLPGDSCALQVNPKGAGVGLSAVAAD